MPGKAQVSVDRYFRAFVAAVPVFGRGQVSTYILAGLGDSAEDILDVCARLIRIGVYPFVVPFVPIAGTPLESHPTPAPAFMHDILGSLADMLRQGGISSSDIKAGCGKCGACSALSTYERARP
jgi:radical SAM protein (TIGR04043 family)